MPRRLDGAGFVNVDVARIGAQHALVRTKRGRDDRGVRLRSSDEKMHRGMRSVA